MKKHPASISHEVAQIEEFRNNPKRAADYLNAAVEVSFQEDDPSLFLTALGVVAKARGMSRLARETGLQREPIYRMFGKTGNPEWKSLFKLFRALHVRPMLRAA